MVHIVTLVFERLMNLSQKFSQLWQKFTFTIEGACVANPGRSFCLACIIHEAVKVEASYNWLLKNDTVGEPCTQQVYLQISPARSELRFLTNKFFTPVFPF